jgi:ABC-type transport system involved in cytochrome bd biosynthesis fused ATPase/permease subunit
MISQFLQFLVITLGYAIFSSDFGHLWKENTIPRIIFIVFLVFVVAILVLQEFMRIREGRSQRSAAIEMHARNSTSADSYYYK